MRKLAIALASFSAAVFAAVLLPGVIWQPLAAGVLLILSAAVFLCRRHLKYAPRVLLILPLLAAGLLYCTAYRMVISQPVQAQCGDMPLAFTGTVCDWPCQTDYGGKVTLRLEGGRGAKAVYYGGEAILTAEPGNRISGMARWQDAGHIRDNDITTFTSRGVYVLLYEAEECTVATGDAGHFRYLPQRMARALSEKIRAVWQDERSAAFVLGELTGDTSAISLEDYAAVKGAGLAHLFAVSGLHCAFLVSLLALLTPANRRRLVYGITVLVLIVYMCMVGLTPSVVRACVMQIMLLAAPLLRRDGDSLTALTLALALILLGNPHAAAGVSLQLSFAATLGLVLFSRRLQRFLCRWYQGSHRWLKMVIAFTATNLAAVLSALVFTLPLTAFYFGSVILVSPISGILAVPAASWNFMVSLLTVLLGFVWLPAARLLSWIAFALIRYVLWIARGLTSLPWHEVYFTNGTQWIWLVLGYALFGMAVLLPGDRRQHRRRYALAAILTVLTLAAALATGQKYVKYGDMTLTAVDVGQGECVIFCSDGAAALVDCGSSNSYIDAADRAAGTMEGMALRRLDALILTHYHADHANGITKLMMQTRIGTLYLPDIEDAYGVRDRLVSLAAEKGIAVCFVEETERISLGQAVLRVFPPVGHGDANEQGLSVLCSAGDFDALVTGDMAATTEKALLKGQQIPDIEVLLVSHHGSKYSSDAAFLASVMPETAIICVGDNSYGHPTEQAISRLHDAGAAVYRTDENGSILVTVYGGK